MCKKDKDTINSATIYNVGPWNTEVLSLHIIKYKQVSESYLAVCWISIIAHKENMATLVLAPLTLYHVNEMKCDHSYYTRSDLTAFE